MTKFDPLARCGVYQAGAELRCADYLREPIPTLLATLAYPHDLVGRRVGFQADVTPRHRY
eukprot:239718-Rhodomonas_salina.3